MAQTFERDSNKIMVDEENFVLKLKRDTGQMQIFHQMMITEGLTDVK